MQKSNSVDEPAGLLPSPEQTGRTYTTEADVLAATAKPAAAGRITAFLSWLTGEESGPLLVNSAWNVAAVIIPGVLTIPAMGIMGRKLGVEMFGLFTLAFGVLGYASILDVGLSRAVIRSVALYRDDERKVRVIVGTASCVVVAFGMLGAAALWMVAAPLTHLLKVTQARELDLVRSFHWLSLGIPCYLLALMWFSYLEGKEHFAELSVLKSITYSLTAVLPVIAVLIHSSLESAVVGLVLTRFISLGIAYVWYHDGRYQLWYFNRHELRELVQFGGWIVVSNITSPIMVYFDRFVLASISGAQTVAFYTAPADGVTRVSVLPGALARSLFPRLNNKAVDANQQARLASRIMLVGSISIGIPIFIFARQIMTLWMGPQYGTTASIALRILTVGFVFNALAQVPFAEIQARGDSRTTAFVHMAEVAPYLALLFFLIYRFSIQGAAVAWTARMFADFVALSALSGRGK